ncbi:hypothetical protein I4F81_008908 [Pyropia yezoensis]|uniref:Uncharacterized protein n=1 Tax=Pyropia yezoensis TaxID=2788 RepID=A0ACC3C9E5_PYRYE|nr:hypothetical protein I4F81_008908 [Neopyropia yezoensis]
MGIVSVRAGNDMYRQSLPPLPLALWQAICHGTPPSRPEGCDRQVRGNMRVSGDRICHPQNESCSAARKENVAAQHDRKQASCAYSKKKKTLTWTEAMTTPPRPPSPGGGEGGGGGVGSGGAGGARGGGGAPVATGTRRGLVRA